jgi:hypothetical protein
MGGRRRIHNPWETSKRWFRLTCISTNGDLRHSAWLGKNIFKNLRQVQLKLRE